MLRKALKFNEAKGYYESECDQLALSSYFHDRIYEVARIAEKSLALK